MTWVKSIYFYTFYHIKIGYFLYLFFVAFNGQRVVYLYLGRIHRQARPSSRQFEHQINWQQTGKEILKGLHIIEFACENYKLLLNSRAMYGTFKASFSRKKQSITKN